MRGILPLIAVLSFAFAPAPFPRSRKPDDRSARIVRAMEGFRVKIPPAQGMAEQEGPSVKELEPYLMTHLAGVARRWSAR